MCFNVSLITKFVSLNKLFFIVSLILFSNPSHFSLCEAFETEVENESPFTYVERTGKGPKKWGQINPDWKACDNGKLQSPIDILNKRVEILADLGKLKRDYKSAPAIAMNRGHDVTVKWKTYAGKITINSTKFDLLQCHWHSPAEHTFNGTRHAMELHIIHSSKSTRQIAVVGIVYKYGRPDPFLKRMLRKIHSLDPHKEKDLGIVNPGEIKFGSRKYYRYLGSLTIPPCTEGVIWTILKKVRTVSREQVRRLRHLVNDGFQANARPTQKSDGRSVFQYSPRENNGESS